MNSQNRMNAGAEYVLYRIWATLQDSGGIHAESLLACVGALAGYACQAYARRAGARAGAQSGESALTVVTAGDGYRYVDGDALNLPLIGSPLSVWALVRRSVEKLGAPLPDIDSISAHVRATLGTSEFGVPRVPDAHRPHLLPMAYLTQLWPQILPIAQRFCRRPAQLPILFGIALQRAVEHTAMTLKPTLGASIAMECALAMSKAALPATLSDLFEAPPAAPDIALKSRRVTRPSLPHSAGTRMRSVKLVATIMSLAVVAIASTAWKADQKEDAPTIARVAVGLKVPAFRPAAAPASMFQQQIQPEQVDESTPPTEESAPAQESLLPPPEELDLPTPPPDRGEGIIAEDWQSA